MGRWPLGQPLFWYLDASNIEASDAVTAAVPIGAGIESWETVCGVYLARTDDRAKAQLIVRFTADLTDDPSVAFDEAQAAAWLSGEELGLTDEPVNAGPDTQLVMRLNLNPLGGWTGLKLKQVAMHESGHFLGFDHPTFDTTAVPSCMSAFLDQRVTTQTPYDAAVAQGLYGLPRAA